MLEVGAFDALDGAPLLDIKPHTARCDAHLESKARWLDAVDAAGKSRRALLVIESALRAVEPADGGYIGSRVVQLSTREAIADAPR